MKTYSAVMRKDSDERCADDCNVDGDDDGDDINAAAAKLNDMDDAADIE